MIEETFSHIFDRSYIFYHLDGSIKSLPLTQAYRITRLHRGAKLEVSEIDKNILNLWLNLRAIRYPVGKGIKIGLRIIDPRLQESMKNDTVLAGA